MGFFSRMFRWNEAASESSLPPPSEPASELTLDAKAAKAVLEELDIETAISVHENWSARLTAVLRGTSQEQLSPDIVCLDNRCELGKWLHGPGRERLGKYPAFTVLVARHKHFHLEASTVLTLSLAGEMEKAEHKLKTGYRHASNQVVLLLKELRRGLQTR
ncbi:MAG: CZB domain-containing protein [Delftia acidovorans]|nr:CZB domain-containing protein [Delftia acidovorans]